MAQSILDVARELIERPEAKAAYADDPEGFMAARGVDGLSSTDLEDAVGFVAETVPAPVARQMAATPGDGADPAPLARLAAANAVEAAVVEPDPRTVDLTALVDPSGQFDIAAVSPAAETASEEAAPKEEDAETEEADEPPTDAAVADSDGAFGTGAGDTEEAGEADEPLDDEESPDDGAPRGAESDPVGAPPGADHHDDALDSDDAGPLGPVEPPEERVEDEFEEMI